MNSNLFVRNTTIQEIMRWIFEFWVYSKIMWTYMSLCLAYLLQPTIVSLYWVAIYCTYTCLAFDWYAGNSGNVQRKKKIITLAMGSIGMWPSFQQENDLTWHPWIASTGLWSANGLLNTHSWIWRSSTQQEDPGGWRGWWACVHQAAQHGLLEKKGQIQTHKTFVTHKFGRPFNVTR